MNNIVRKRQYICIYLLSCIGFLFSDSSPFMETITIITLAACFLLLGLEYHELDGIIDDMKDPDIRMEWRRQVLLKIGKYNICHAIILGWGIVLVVYLDQGWVAMFFLELFSIMLITWRTIKIINMTER